MLRLKKIHKLNLTHLHELDFKAYEKKKGEEKRIRKEQIDNFGLLPESPKTNIFTEAGIDFSNNQMTFVHPLYFYNHLKTAGMLEFNPYAGKDVITIENPKTVCHVYDNPGFAPFMPSEYPDAVHHFQGYAPVTGHFRDNYDGKAHAGVDFDGPNIKKALRNTNTEAPIKSLIYAKYIGGGNYGNLSWGRFLVFQSIQYTNHFYILAHLSETNGCVINFSNDAIVTPGTIVGYVGNTGNCSNCKTQEQRDKGNGAHLHVQLVVKDKSDQVYNSKTKALMSVNDYSINPFDYNDKYSKTNFRG